MSLASRIRARFNHLFPPTPPLPTPGPRVVPPSVESIPSPRRRVIVDPIHPDFLEKVDPLWPISEELLEKNAMGENSVSRKIHPHTAFGRTGFGMVAIPQTITTPIRGLVEGISLNKRTDDSAK